MIKVKWSDLEDAHSYVAMSHLGEARAGICKKTGKIFTCSDSFMDDDPEEEEFWESENYVSIPDKYDLDLGNELAFEFVAANLPDQQAEVYRIFCKKGAYGRFKDLLSRHDCLEAWYAFEQAKTKEELTHWAEVNEIEIIFDQVDGPQKG